MQAVWPAPVAGQNEISVAIYSVAESFGGRGWHPGARTTGLGHHARPAAAGGQRRADGGAFPAQWCDVNAENRSTLFASSAALTFTAHSWNLAALSSAGTASGAL